jgi:hypothetical protein
VAEEKGAKDAVAELEERKITARPRGRIPTKRVLRPTWLKRWAQKSFTQDFTFLMVHPPPLFSSLGVLVR